MYDVVIIGAGAAGMMAAGTAASEGKRVLLLEKMEKAGRKIRITGKGKCNLTNSREISEFFTKIRANPDFLIPSLKEFDNNDTIDFFRQEGVKLSFERGGRVFPASEKAWDIAEALIDWAKDSGAEIQYHTKVRRIRTLGGKINGVTIVNRNGFERNIECKNIIIATGGLSYPATGSTGDGYELAHCLGHEIIPLRPTLVPLVSNSPLAKALIGLKLKNVSVKLLVNDAIQAEEFGEMEFTSRGLEGAVILKISRTAVDALIDECSVGISIDLKTALTEETIKNRIERELESLEGDFMAADLLRKLMPKPMVAPFAREAGIHTKMPLSQLNEENKTRIVYLLKNFNLPISDYRPFEEAIVTAGGISTDQINPDSLESALVKGLYFAGEVIDVDADTGGYNLQIAFSTGRLAGKLKK